MNNVIIKSSNLTKIFGDAKAVDNLNLEIYEGEIVRLETEKSKLRNQLFTISNCEV